MNEDMIASPEGTGGSVGSAFNVPGSVPGMGNPVAPTPDTEGSGDNFNPSVNTKKKKKKQKAIVSFKDFIKGLSK